MHPRKARRCRSVHHQVLIIALLPALVVTAIVAIVMYRGTLVQGKQTLLRQGAMLAEQLATKLEYTLSTGAVEQLPDILAATLDPTRHVLGTDIGQVTVFDKDDQVLYHTTFLASSQGPASAPAAPARSAPATAATQIFTAAIYLTPLGLELYPGQQPTKRYLGKVRLEMLTTTVEAELSRRFLRDVAFVLGTFCGALVLAHWTGRRFSRSLQEAAGAISQIKGGNLRIHLPQTETNEIGTLQEGVNLLADTLATAREKLERELARVRNEYHQVLEDLRLQTQEAHQANQAKSLFLAKISHEMRTPLYSIQGLTERRLKVGQRADERSDLQGIQTAAHKLHLIISDILDYTQLESGRYVSSLTMIDLWAALETEIETVGPLASRQPLYLDVIVEDAVPSVVMGDAKAFRAILANLIANAVKFTEHGGVIIRLGVASRQDATVQIRVMVQDTGPGIPEDHLTTIFTPFEQVDGALNRRYGGSGLGLSIVKGYCDSLGGFIQVDSQVNHGTTFTVTLPFTTTAEGAARVPTDSLRYPPGIRILVADDRASFRASVRCRLANQAAEVAEQHQTLPLLLNMPPPVQPYDVLIGQDLSRLSQEALSALTERITPWARYLVSLETVNDPSSWPWLRCHGVAAALWCGATRAAWQEALSFPVSDNPPTAMTEAACSGESPPASTVQHTVLVVEDFEINRAIMAYQLQSHGFRVIEAGDGEEAVTKTRQGGIDLILMDIQMPGKDGLTAIREIRAQPDGVGLPILGFTASADKPTHHQIMAAGADKVLTKPISEAELIAAVQQALVIPQIARTAVSP